MEKKGFLGIWKNLVIFRAYLEMKLFGAHIFVGQNWFMDNWRCVSRGLYYPAM